MIDYVKAPLKNHSSRLRESDNPCDGIENTNDFIHKKTVKKRAKYKVYVYDKNQAFLSHAFKSSISVNTPITGYTSMPEMYKDIKSTNVHTINSDVVIKNSNQFKSKYVVNLVSEYRTPISFNPYNKIPIQTKWKVYRCQLSTKEESCCCSCNSDAMFEVMKSLYDCYKKKNCDHCNCILCGHMPRSERDLAALRKSLLDMGMAAPIAKERLQKAKAAGLLTPLEGKTAAEKEKIIKGLAMQGLPLPVGKTDSEKELVAKVRAQLGLPPEPRSPSLKEKYNKAISDGVMVPLEGKTQAEKEKILKKLADRGLPLPEGRTTSEKALIDKIRAKAPKKGIPSEKLRKAKAAGLLTPLAGKSPEKKEQILRGLAMEGLPLPEAKTPSEKKLIDKVRAELGLPLEPTTPSLKEKYNQALNEGALIPLEGKTAAEKENILTDLAERGLPLPKGRTPSEKALIAKVKAKAVSKLSPSERMQKAMATGLITPLEGKTPEQKEKIIRGLAMGGLPIPEGKTSSERKLIDKVRADLGLPPEPKTPSLREKYNKAANDGLIVPLDGKTPTEKEKILQDLAERGIPLPEGRTPSEKAIIAKVKAMKGIPSEKLRRAKAAGLITPLAGKSPEQKVKILRGLANEGIPLPIASSPSEQKLIDKVRAELGLPPEPKTPSQREKYNQAAREGLMVPLAGKTPAEKEKILQGLAQRGIPLPEGRTPSEKALINKVKAKIRPIPSEKLRKARAAGLLTPLEGKTPEEKEKILRGLAMEGLPLPEGKTPSAKKLINKIHFDLGLPPPPDNPSLREKYNKAANEGRLVPLEGKAPAEKRKILQDLVAMGIPLPEGRTKSEKALIADVKLAAAAGKPLSPSEKIRRAKDAGFLTPLTGKTSEEKENILSGLANLGLPLPEGKTKSERSLITKVRADLGLPPEPKTPSMREKYEKAAKDGILLPLEGKTPDEKEKILQDLAARGIPLPKGRTPSEKAMIAKIRSKRPSKATPSERLRRAKEAGLLTPLAGKSPEEKEKIIKGLAMEGLPLPEGKTPSEKKLIKKIRDDLGLPPEPTTSSLKRKYSKAAKDGLLVPLEGKNPAEKERILQDLAERGIPLPEGRTPSEKSLISKVKAKALPPSEGRTSRRRRSGVFTPIKGKTPEEKEKILRGLAKRGLPLPESTTPSEKKIIDKVRADFGLPPEPKTSSIRQKYAKAQAAGLITPLEGKTPQEKEKILRGLANMGVPLPEGRSPSEKAMIAAIKSAPTGITTEKIRQAKAAGILTPLQGKTPEQKEKILKGLAKAGLPLPVGKTASEKELIRKIKSEYGIPEEPLAEKVRKAQAAGLLAPLTGKTPAQKEKTLRSLAAVGLPLPEGKTPSEKALIKKVKADSGYVTPSKSERMKVAKAAGLLTPLKGKSPSTKEKLLKARLATGLPLPEGATASEKSLIKKIAEGRTPSAKLRQAKADGLLTPLEGKTPQQKEKILRGLAKAGLPLPEAKTTSDRSLANKIRNELGLPPEPRSPSLREKYKKALSAGIITPLEGKTPAQKERIFKKMQDAGLPLPAGRTPSEKAIIKKLQAAKKITPSEKEKEAKALGLLTPLEGKTPAQREKILKKLAQAGLPLPEGKTTSEKDLIKKVKRDLGLPPEPKTPSVKEKLRKAQAAGLITPLEGKTQAQKEKILRDLADAGIPLPEGRTPSEKALIKKYERPLTASEKRRRPPVSLTGKSPEEKAKIMRDLANQGLPLPKAKTASEKNLANQIRKELGLPPEPKSASEKEKYDNAQAAGLIEPLEGKTPAEKEKILRNLANMGVPLPEGRNPSEKALVEKVRGESRTPIPSEKWRKAKAAGLLTPIQGKMPAEKEKILKGLAEAGLPLPEGKTASDKSMIRKIKTELGIPPTAMTPSEKEVVRKAKAEGFLTPLAGKSPAEKEKILRGLAEAGLPLPEGKTASEKALIKKVRAAAGLPPELTPSEKAGRIRRKSRRVGAATMRRASKGIGLAKSKAGIAEELEEIVKTTKCDRACGCDKKKIRFKHSYVKIRVTSPDISSLCPCPNECIPGVKAGVFTDNEGIKVTVGSAVGFPSYSKDNIPVKSKIPNDVRLLKLNGKEFYSETSIISHKNRTEVSIIKDNSAALQINNNKKNIEYILKYYPNQNDKPDYINQNHTFESGSRTITSLFEQVKFCTSDYNNSIYSCSPGHSTISFISQDNYSSGRSSGSSFSLLLVVKSESSLQLSTDVISSLSLIYDGSASSFESDDELESNHHWCPVTNKYKHRRIEDLECLVHGVDYEAANSITRISRTKLNRDDKNKTEPILVINNLSNHRDIMSVVDEYLSTKPFSGSSIFVVVPSNDVIEKEPSKDNMSTIGNQISAHSLDQINVIAEKPNDNTVFVAFDIENPVNKNEIQQTSTNQAENLDSASMSPTKNKRCQVYVTKDRTRKKDHIITTDTMNRPCLCTPQGSLELLREHDKCVANALSELLIPIFGKQAQHLSCRDGFQMDENYPPVQSVVDITRPSEHSVKIYSMPPFSGLHESPQQLPPHYHRVRQPSSAQNTAGPCPCVHPPPDKPVVTKTHPSENSKGIRGLARCMCPGESNQQPPPQHYHHPLPPHHQRHHRQPLAAPTPPIPLPAPVPWTAAKALPSDNSKGLCNLPPCLRHGLSDQQPPLHHLSQPPPKHHHYRHRQPLAGHPPPSQPSPQAQSVAAKTNPSENSKGLCCLPPSMPLGGCCKPPRRHHGPLKFPTRQHRHRQSPTAPSAQPSPQVPLTDSKIDSSDNSKGQSGLNPSLSPEECHQPPPQAPPTPPTPPSSLRVTATHECCCSMPTPNGHQPVENNHHRTTEAERCSCHTTSCHQKTTVQTNTDQLCEDTYRCPIHAQIRKVASDLTQTSSTLKISMTTYSSAECQVSQERRPAMTGVEPFPYGNFQTDACCLFPSPPSTPPPSNREGPFIGFKLTKIAKR